MVATLARRRDLEVVWYLPYVGEARRVEEALSSPLHSLVVPTPLEGHSTSAPSWTFSPGCSSLTGARVGALLGVAYLRDGRLAGEGLAQTRAPQRYGITSLAQALEGELATGPVREASADG